MSKSQGLKQRLYEEVNICEKVRKTISSKGWSEILGPKLKKMIESVTGQQDKRGIYVRGLIDDPHGSTEYYIGYKAALMDFHNEVYNHVVALEAAKDSIRTLEDVSAKEQRYTRPMEDTRYAGEEEK